MDKRKGGGTCGKACVCVCECGEAGGWVNCALGHGEGRVWQAEQRCRGAEPGGRGRGCGEGV